MPEQYCFFSLKLYSIISKNIFSFYFQSENKKESEKLIKNIIKVVIKIGVLYRNGQFGDKEMQEGERLHKRLHAAAMAVMSFHEVEYSYDRLYLTKQVKYFRFFFTIILSISV